MMSLLGQGLAIPHASPSGRFPKASPLGLYTLWDIAACSFLANGTLSCLGEYGHLDLYRKTSESCINRTPRGQHLREATGFGILAALLLTSSITIRQVRWPGPNETNLQDDV